MQMGTTECLVWLTIAVSIPAAAVLGDRLSILYFSVVPGVKNFAYFPDLQPGIRRWAIDFFCRIEYDFKELNSRSMPMPSAG